MSYTALYRKFRPSEFSDVKGQDHIVTTLKNQINADRIGHAYLFCGTRGTGKTTVAKIFAKAVNCEHPVDGNPCGECASCRAIAAGTSMNVIEIDAASNNGVDNIREIRDEVAYSPTEGKYKVYIIDEVHMLSIGAFNALLKTLEEPPSYVIFILATTEAHKIPITILSRCQRYDFRRITVETIADRLRELTEKEQVEVEDKALTYIAKAADGSMRDALSLLDQCIAFYLGQKLTYDHVLDVLGAVDTDVFGDLFRKICDQKLTDVVRELEQIILQGRELSQFVTDFIWYLRNLLMLKSDQNMEDVLDVSTERLAQMKRSRSDRYGYAHALYSCVVRIIRTASLCDAEACACGTGHDQSCAVRQWNRIMILFCRGSVCWNSRWKKGIPMMAAVESGAAQSRQETESRSQEKLPREALSTDVRMFVDRFQELRRKMGGMQSQQLKDAALRELPDGTGVQIILARELPVDEQELADSVEKMIERELKVRMKVQIHTPHTDPRPQDPVTDLSGFIDMDIDIEP